MARVMLEVNELTTKYITRFQENIYAVDHVSLKVEEGKSLGIAGESGCGKTTIMLSLLLLLPEAGRIVGGQILFDDRDLLQISERERHDHRRRDATRRPAGMRRDAGNVDREALGAGHRRDQFADRPAIEADADR